MNERLVHLKIKIESLAAESRNIRKEANKTSGMAKWNLNHHRKTTVRVHTRLNLLAYGMLRGVPYGAIERQCRTAPNFDTVVKHAKKFGATDDDLAQWVEDAKAYLKKITDSPSFSHERVDKLMSVGV